MKLKIKDEVLGGLLALALLGSAFSLVKVASGHTAARDQAQEQEIQKDYAFYNDLFFDNKLPKNTLVTYANIPGFMGLTFECGEQKKMCIVIDRASNSVSRVAKMTLLHEMIHVKLWNVIDFDIHGTEFQNEMHRLANEHAFDELW
jgi:hypothetical protein